LRAAGLGFTEVVPLERVLDAPQARHPGKLRAYAYRGLGFEIPEFPGGSADEPSLPPPEIGAHSIELMTALGLDETQRATLLAAGAVVAAGRTISPGRRCGRKADADLGASHHPTGATTQTHEPSHTVLEASRRRRLLTVAALIAGLRVIVNASERRRIATHGLQLPHGPRGHCDPLVMKLIPSKTP